MNGGLILSESVTFAQMGGGLAVVVGLMSALLLALHLKEKLLPKEKVKSVQVHLEEQFPTRREFEKLEGEVAEIQKELPQMERRIVREVKELGKSLATKIDEFGSTSHRGREKIWDELNDVRERMSSAESITKQFEKA